MKKRTHYIPTIKFNKYVYLGIIILVLFLLAWLNRQKNGGIKIGGKMLIMKNYNAQVDVSTGDRAKYEEQVKKYDNLITTATGVVDQDLFIKKAENLAYLGQFTDSIKTINQALIYYPNSLIALDMLGNIYAIVGEYEYAIQNYNKVIQQDPKLQSAYAKQIILMNIWLGNVDTAGKLYIQYIKDGGQPDLELINKIRDARKLDPITK